MAKPDLPALVRDAWHRGETIDLAGAGYGRIHWGDRTRVVTHSMDYYRTLAGFAALTGAKTAIEIGTHWGGSGLAIVRGMMSNHGVAARLITADITGDSDNIIPKLAEAAQITKIKGDANQLDTIEAIVEAAAGATVHFLYIDAMHSADATLANFGYYASLFAPRIALFDDIVLEGTDMARFWALMRRAYPDHTINCVDVVPESRSATCGFGLWVRP